MGKSIKLKGNRVGVLCGPVLSLCYFVTLLLLR
jgi:hypothetical protein